MKSWFVAIAALATTLVPVSWAETEEVEEEKILTVNWYHWGEYLQPVLDVFTEKTGIPVIVTDDYDNFNTDVVLVADYKSLLEGKNFYKFDRFNDDFYAELSEIVPEYWRDEDQRWVGVVLRGRTAIVNKHNVPESERPSSILDLADPKWQGRLTLRQASNVYNRSSVAYVISRYGEEEATRWVNGMVANLEGAAYLNDIEQAFAIANGEYDVGFMNTYYLGYLPDWWGEDEPENVQAVADNIEVVWLDDGFGQFMNVTGVAIAAPVLKGTENHRQAQELIRFLLSQEGQALLSEHIFKYPVRADTPPSEYLQSHGEFKLDEFDVNDLRYLYGTADRIMAEAGWETEF